MRPSIENPPQVDSLSEGGGPMVTVAKLAKVLLGESPKTDRKPRQREFTKAATLGKFREHVNSP